MKSKILVTSFLIVGIIVSLLISCNRAKTVKPVRKAITEAVYASGYIVPKNEYKLYALSDGYIVAKYKDDGDSIKKGEAIFKVQNDVYSAKLTASTLAYEVAKRNSEDNSPVLMDLKNKIRTAEAKFKNDSINYVRNKNMFAAGAITKSQLDQAELAVETSTNDLSSAREDFRKTNDQLQVDLKDAQSTLTSSGLDLSNYLLTSMMDGEVYETYKELGEAVKKNEEVALIGERGHKILQLSVDQQDVEKVKLGLEVVVKMDVTGDKVYKAHISKIYPNMNQSDQSFKVEAEFDEKYGFDFVHSSVEANIIIGHKDNALLIPRDAVQGEDEVELKGLGLNKMVKIEKGLQTLEFVEVLKGINENDQVVMPQPKQ